ncbi:hypothetical protein D3C78_1367260 [compost metagenome]
MLKRRQSGFNQTQITRHAQVADQRADFGVDQQILGATLDQHNALPRQAHIEVFGDRPAQAPVTHDHPADPLAFQVRGNPATGGFDFWQFRHGVLGSMRAEVADCLFESFEVVIRQSYIIEYQRADGVPFGIFGLVAQHAV